VTGDANGAAGAGRQARPRADRGPRRAVFLDRDGTVIVEADYLDDPTGVELVPGAAGAIRRLREAGLAVVIVTNQSGIARGLYGLDDYRAVAARLDARLVELGAPVDGTYYCPHHPDFTGPCTCRKPGPGMYRRAARELDLSLDGSWYVGDKPTDVLPALHFGGYGILLRTGHGADPEVRAPEGVDRAADIVEAADRILEATGVPPGPR